MKIVKPSYEILIMDGLDLMEIAGRTCYKSIPKGDPDEFVRRAIREAKPRKDLFNPKEVLYDQNRSHNAGL